MPYVYLSLFIPSKTSFRICEVSYDVPTIGEPESYKLQKITDKHKGVIYWHQQTLRDEQAILDFNPQIQSEISRILQERMEPPKPKIAIKKKKGKKPIQENLL